MKKVLLLTAVLVVVLAVVVGCRPQATPAPTKVPATREAEPTETPRPVEEKPTLVLGFEGSPPSFDCIGAPDDNRVDMPCLQLYNTLVQYEPGTLELNDELAKSHKVSDDGLTYTFELRKGVKFHDGSELTAEDVKYTIDRVLALKKGIYRIISAVADAEVIDDYTVALHLDEPFPPLLQALARLYILNADVVKEHEVNDDWGQEWLSDHEAGSGPYTLVSWQREREFVLEKHSEYFEGWDGEHAGRAVVKIIPKDAERQMGLARGTLDWAPLWSVDTYLALKEDSPELEFYSDPTLNVLYVAFNTNSEYLSDPRIRKALSLVYDYEAHVEKVRQGQGEIARGPIPPSIPCFDESIGPSKMDVERAKELMSQTDYPDGGFELSLAYQGTAAEEVGVANLLQSGAQELGIEVKPEAMGWPAKTDRFSSPETAPDMGTIWIFPSYPDPDPYLYVIGHSENAGGGGLNFAYYSNPEFDKVVKQARTETDTEKRCELYKEAQQLWLDDVPYMNITVGYAMSAAQPDVSGYEWSPAHAYTVSIYDMWKE